MSVKTLMVLGMAVAALADGAPSAGATPVVPDGLGKTLVRNPVVTAPEEWKPPVVMGKSFRPRFQIWSADLEDPVLKQMSCFRECSRDYVGWKELGVSDIRRPKSKTPDGKPGMFERAPEAERFPGGYRLRDFMNDRAWSRFFREYPPQEPFFLSVSEVRSEFRLGYTDRSGDLASHREFCERHPNFLGFGALIEFDTSTLQYIQGVAHVSGYGPVDPEAERIVLSRYPLPRDRFGVQRNYETCYTNAMRFLWGDPRLWTMGSGTASMAAQGGAAYEKLGKKGMGGFSYEAAMNTESGCWAFGAAYTRGTARRYGRPFVWFAANHYGYPYDRNGKKCSYGHALYPCSRTMKDAARTGWKPFVGAGLSLQRRQWLYGFLSGAGWVEPEAYGYSFFADTDREGVCKPSPYLESFEEIYRLTKKIDRGVQLTPIAFVTPLSEPIGRGGPSWGYDLWVGGAKDTENRDLLSVGAFLFTCVPPRNRGREAGWLSDREHGDQGCLYNSPIGDVWDGLASFRGEDSAAFAKALAPYRAVFTVGGFGEGEFDTEALLAYAEGGGTLFIGAERILRGEIPADAAGVNLAADAKVDATGDLLAADGSVFATLGERYEFHVPQPGTKARCIVRDRKGNAAVWSHDCGRGRIVTVAAAKMLPPNYADYRDVGGNFGIFRKRCEEQIRGTRTFPIVDALVRTVQAETIPFAIDGDCQWGVNKVEVRGGGGQRMIGSSSGGALGDRALPAGGESGALGDRALPDDGRGRSPSGPQSNNQTIQQSNNSPRWLVWLYNNKGVKKFNLEPDEIDRSMDATVTITPKKWIGVSRAVDVETDRPLEMKDGRLTVKVPAGGWRIVTLAQ